RLRQRVVPALGRLAPPSWEADPAFDIDYHIKVTALPGPASMRDLLDQATRIHQAPLERTRPLWEFTILGGLEGGRAAIVQKMHHTVTDGVGGLRLAEHFVDLERHPDEPESDGERLPDPGAVQTTVLGRLAGTAAHLAERGAGLTVGAVRAGVDLATHPTKLGSVGADVVGTARSVVREVGATTTTTSDLWSPRTLRRRVETLRVPLADVKATAAAHEVTVNDVFVTAAARGAGAYHAAMGDDVEELRMAMPMSTRTDNSEGGNAFALTRTWIPVHEADPAAHLAAVHAALAASRGEQAFRVLDQLAAAANALPTSALVRLARAQTEAVHFTTSNLRGAPIPLYMGGARVEANYPIGPLAGTAFNLTLLSYDGWMNMGLHVDSGAVEQPGALRDAIDGAFREMLAS
ncbi:MAG: wax ester/triacylglycerol synthase domain-containing protein, partial [Actinomycetota bacterium]